MVGIEVVGLNLMTTGVFLPSVSDTTMLVLIKFSVAGAIIRWTCKLSLSLLVDNVNGRWGGIASAWWSCEQKNQASSKICL